ncbi:GTP-binding protein, partial [Clostridium sp.]|uniref:GTP-binding protein n=1 Tax=Clostridium sp. TaxID=1506 RepID=UPI003F3995BE
VEKVVKTISKINPKALIVKDNWENINGKEILTLSRDSSVSIKGNRAFKGRLRKESVKEENNFESFAVYLNRKTSKEELFSKFKFISSCSSYGEVLRAKGIVKLMDGSHGQFDFVKDEFVIRSIKAESSSVISFIGVNLNKDELGKIFK